MKYIKKFEESIFNLYSKHNSNLSEIEHTKYKVGDYVVLDLDKINLDVETSEKYSEKYCKVIWIDYKQFNVNNGYPYEVEYLDETEQLSVKEDEILRLMTPEEIITSKYNI